MDSVVDLAKWRQTRGHGRAQVAIAGGPEGVRRLELAIHRLDSVASVALESRGELEAWVETELLAIMGALSMDLLDDAADRAERLADRISRATRAAGK